MSGRTDLIHARFWAKVSILGQDECWLWTGAKLTKGYGVFNNDGAHRTAWTIINGPIPEGLFVLHRCDNPPCVNPHHLFLGDAAANARDMAIKNRAGASKLSIDDVRWLREWGALDWPQRLLALAIGCSQTNVSNILTKKNRKHV